MGNFSYMNLYTANSLTMTISISLGRGILGQLLTSKELMILIWKEWDTGELETWLGGEKNISWLLETSPGGSLYSTRERYRTSDEHQGESRFMQARM